MVNQDSAREKAMDEYAKSRGIENLDDRALLPKNIYPNLAKMPFYSGEGAHSAAELQEMCQQFKEYCHQQSIIKFSLLSRLGWCD